MGKYSEILVTIEELWMGNTDDVSVISDKVFEEYGIRYSEEDINDIITEWAQDWREAQDQAYLDDMDGDHASALASAGFGTDEDYGYYGE